MKKCPKCYGSGQWSSDENNICGLCNGQGEIDDEAYAIFMEGPGNSEGNLPYPEISRPWWDGVIVFLCLTAIIVCICWLLSNW